METGNWWMLASFCLGTLQLYKGKGDMEGLVSTTATNSYKLVGARFPKPNQQQSNKSTESNFM